MNYDEFWEFLNLITDFMMSKTFSLLKLWNENFRNKVQFQMNSGSSKKLIYGKL